MIVYRTDLWLTKSRMTCWFVTIQADCSYWNKALIFIASRFFKFHEVFQPVNFKFYVYVLWSCNAFALDLALGNLMVSTFVWTNPLSCLYHMNPVGMWYRPNYSCCWLFTISNITFLGYYFCNQFVEEPSLSILMDQYLESSKDLYIFKCRTHPLLFVSFQKM